MARLAAYYQEDFHFAPAGYGPKQRKAYVVYESPGFDAGYVHDGHRLRGLASSEPALCVPAPQPARMMLTQKPQVFDAGDWQSRRHWERAYENPEYMSCVQRDPYDGESVYSHARRSVHDDPYPARSKSRSKGTTGQRFFYNDSWNRHSQCPEIYAPRAVRTHPRTVDGCDPYQREYFQEEPAFVDRTEDNFYPPDYYNWDSNHGQCHPWAFTETHTSPVLLSPPSPLDSGLSSQSITSSPSLEAELSPMHSGTVSRSGRHHHCCCSGKFHQEHPPHGSGRSPSDIHPRRTKLDSAAYLRSNGHHGGSVRYGMLGLVGEPLNDEHWPKKSKDRSRKVVRSSSSCGQRPGSRGYPSDPKYSRPCVVITEASEKGSGTSPDQSCSEKSPEPESSVSLMVSNSASNSSSVASSSNELNGDAEPRQANKTMEKGIRELEDMYQKCNLGDYDLLERAERRDLPTAHQARRDQVNLSRSKSDTLYETLGRNPYENPQRAPPLRRSGIPDRVADDMALRKHRRPATGAPFNPAEKSITYMLCSSHFTPTVAAGRDLLLADDPDVEYDDFSYRRHYFGKKSRLPDPQPPFGIPLKPPPPQRVFSDYLHATVPSAGLQPLCHPRGNPDVVRDDLAFRALRKDEPERMYYDMSQIYRKKRG